MLENVFISYYNLSCMASLPGRLITSLPSLLDKEIESEMLQRMQIQIHSCEILIPYRHAHPDVAVIEKWDTGSKICPFHKVWNGKTYSIINFSIEKIPRALELHLRLGINQVWIWASLFWCVGWEELWAVFQLLIHDTWHIHGDFP